MKRPSNHITRRRDARVSLHAEAWPDVPEELVAFLEARYPPLCKEPGEDLEAHMQHGGKVSLIAELRDHVRKDDDAEEMPEDEEAEKDAIVAQAERVLAADRYNDD